MSEMIWDDKKKRNLLAAAYLLTTLFVFLVRIFPAETLHLYFAFFLLLIPLVRWNFSFRDFGRSLLDLKGFWLPFVLTLAALIALRFVRVEMAAWMQSIHISEEGTIDLYTNGSTDLVLFALTMMILKPVGEGLLFRSRNVLHPDRVLMLFLVAESLLFQLLLYVDKPVGVLYMLLQIAPLTLSFLLTKNPYVPLMAHIIFEIYDNALFVAYAFARMSYS